jgi:hypothetical protein
MSPDSDPFEQFRKKKLAEQDKQKQHGPPHGEVAGDLDPDTDRLLRDEIGAGEEFAQGKPKGFESHRYREVPKEKYEKPKGFETDRFEPEKGTE